MAESTDLIDVDRDAIVRLYSDLKKLRDDGNGKKEPASVERSAMESPIRLFRVDAAIPVTLDGYCKEKGLEKKIVLEQLLDTVFSYQEIGSRLNLGALLREYLLSPTDVADVRKFIRSSAYVSPALICREFLFTTSEIELLLAVIFANISDNLVREQFEAADHIHVPTLTEQDIVELTGEFDTALEELQREKNHRIASVDSAVDISTAETNATFNLVFAQVAELTRSIEKYKTQVTTVDLPSCTSILADVDYSHCAATSDVVVAEPEVPPSPPTYVRVSSALVEYAVSSGSEEVLPRLPTRNVQAVSAIPSPLSSVGSSFDTIPKARELSLLSREQPSSLSPPAVADYCLAKWDDQWVTAVFVQLDTDGLPVVKFGQRTVTVAKEHIAYASPPSWYMEPGQRVVAPFAMKENVLIWRSAIVADQPSMSRNGGRYLVFNEFGDARYVGYLDIRCSWRQSKSSTIWSDIANHDIRDFLKQLISALPERALVRLKPKSVVRMMGDNGAWKKCLVEEVDGFMALLRSPEGHCSWIYRGDRRLEPIHEQRAQASRPSIVRRHSRFTGPVIEYVDDETDDDIEEAEPLVVESSRVPTARKKTGPRHRSAAIIGQLGANTIRTWEALKSQEIVETYIRTVHVQVRENANESRRSCDEYCVSPNAEPDEYKNENPLLIPILCGWQRIAQRKRTRTIIMYIPPCNHHRFGQPNELQEFLVQTGCRLTIDLFDFDTNLDPRRSIRIINSLRTIDDFSKGRENVKIECVNALTPEEPPPLHYEAHRFTTDSTVDLVAAKGFISGCDCTDNCANSRRCQCQLMTMQQATSRARSRPKIFPGYRFRRLPEGDIATGIYECNSNCSCDCRCPNRVVQRPLMTRLQLFRTNKKGWGVRARDDLPKGAFVCIYAGNVLSDDAANRVGRGAGGVYFDEYFADLDLISCAELHKEGYEEEVQHSDSEESEESTIVRKRPRTVYGSSSDDEVHESDSERESVAGSHGGPWSLGRYLGGDKGVFILDAKISGNIGRYLNHSCAPNIFVQNVFVDTHDMRLPWVAFFASEMIKAGTELCWDYRYTPIPGRRITCECGARECRGRLM